MKVVTCFKPIKPFNLQKTLRYFERNLSLGNQNSKGCLGIVKLINMNRVKGFFI